MMGGGGAAFARLPVCDTRSGISFGECSVVEQQPVEARYRAGYRPRCLLQRLHHRPDLQAGLPRMACLKRLRGSSIWVSFSDYTKLDRNAAGLRGRNRRAAYRPCGANTHPGVKEGPAQHDVAGLPASTPWAPSLLASQATPSAGWPSTPAATPVSSISELRLHDAADPSAGRHPSVPTGTPAPPRCRAAAAVVPPTVSTILARVLQPRVDDLQRWDDVIRWRAGTWMRPTPGPLEGACPSRRRAPPRPAGRQKFLVRHLGAIPGSSWCRTGGP